MLHGFMQEENKVKEVGFSSFIYNCYRLMKVESLGGV